MQGHEGREREDCNSPLCLSITSAPQKEEVGGVGRSASPSLCSQASPWDALVPPVARGRGAE